jgi:hypothetical protein
VLQRIESHPALTAGRIVPEQMRDEAVRRLVKGDRNMGGMTQVETS